MSGIVEFYRRSAAQIYGAVAKKPALGTSVRKPSRACSRAAPKTLHSRHAHPVANCRDDRRPRCHVLRVGLDESLGSVRLARAIARVGLGRTKDCSTAALRGARGVRASERAVVSSEARRAMAHGERLQAHGTWRYRCRKNRGHRRRRAALLAHPTGAFATGVVCVVLSNVQIVERRVDGAHSGERAVARHATLASPASRTLSRRMATHTTERLLDDEEIGEKRGATSKSVMLNGYVLHSPIKR
jgi:hypothetical protein